MPIYLLATLDTKGPEAALVRDRLRELGLAVTVVDVGCLGEPSFAAEVSRAEVYVAAGSFLTDAVAKGDRGSAVTLAADGAAKIVAEAFGFGKVEGVLALGGSAGTTIGTQAMRGLPIGVPKLMVSTLASGQVQQWIGSSDILMLNSVVDIAGINRISRRVLNEAAAAMAGLVKFRAADRDEDKPLIAATMFGVTTPCVQRAREVLEAAGYEVLVFHATGSGGRAMESLIASGIFAGMLDITTTELADELVGGILSAGPDRLTAAAKYGVPQVVSVGALDMVNFGPRETVPAKFAGRQFHIHNATVTLMRTTPDECAQLGAEIARKLSSSTAPVSLLLPLKGLSAIDRAGQPFEDTVARKALFEGIKCNREKLDLQELDLHINDEAFAEAAAQRLIAMLSEANRSVRAYNDGSVN
jgi:uncharacterized protein (UPF0261 family)